MRRTGLALALVLVAACVFAPSALAFGQVAGSPFATGTQPYSVAFSPGGRLLATANAVSDDLSLFAVDQTTGALTPVSGSPFSTGGLYPFSVAFSPVGGLLAVANFNPSNTVAVFAVDPTTGVPTAVPGSPFATGYAPRSVAFSPGGRLLATANIGDGTVSVFAVQTTGALTPVSGSPFPTSTSGWGVSQPYSVAFSPSGGLLATANAGADTVSVFAVNPTTGALTAVPRSPFAITAIGQTTPQSVAFSPGGTLLATANRADSSVSVFAVDQTTGALTAVSGSPFATGVGPFSVAFSAIGGLLATSNYANNVSVFAVGQTTGALSEVSGSPFATGTSPYSVAFSPGGGLLATANQGDGTVSVFSTATRAPQAIAFTSTPPAAAVVGGSYAVAATGGASGNPVTFTIDPSSAAGACSISAATVSFTGGGSCVIDANQAGNASYLAAPQVQQSLSVTVTPTGVVALTLQYVQTSAKYQALTAPQKSAITGLANLLSSALTRIAPNLTPAQKTALINAYKAGVAALKAGGWLTPAQAATLTSAVSQL